MSFKKSVIRSREISDPYYKIEIEVLEGIKEIKAGQFVMIKVDQDPILAKPFSIMDQEGSKLTIFNKEVGKLTRLLKEKPIGSEILVRGPYGTPYVEKIDLSKKYLLAGGGSGVPPLEFFYRKNPDSVLDRIYGIKCSGIRSVLPDMPINNSSESGRHTVDIVEEIYEENRGDDVKVMACGPTDMLKVIDSMFSDDAFVSLEENMGCGIGFCKSCAVKTPEGIKMTCEDGPLFKASEVDWNWLD